nr:MAG TPA: hypothetical protein [Caudoviricetes sp.]
MRHTQTVKRIKPPRRKAERFFEKSKKLQKTS